MQRLEGARTTEIAALQSELESTKTTIREQTVAKDRKINELVEELGNTQALLSAKTAEFDQVCSPPALPSTG